MVINFEREVGFIWDVDGVIVDSPHELAWRRTAEKWGVYKGGLDSRFYRDYVSGRPRYEGGNEILKRFLVYEHLGAGTDAEKEKVLEQYCTQKNELFKELVREGRFNIFGTSIAMAIEARTRGVMQAVASASKNAKSLLMQITSDRIFEVVRRRYDFIEEKNSLYSIFDVDASGLTGKDKSEIFAFAAQRLHELSGGKIRHYIVFEDAPSGIGACKKNRMFGVGIRRIGERSALVEAGADIVVDDLGELGYDELKSAFLKIF